MTAYYNEHDRDAAAWLRVLIAEGHIAPGVVDERSIEDVRPDELRPFTQCHFFAGIGVWSYALRAAGWPDDRRVWTGSCPCQPFSAAGEGNGFADERHLWPAFFQLIAQRRPHRVYGEQVASKDGLAWLDLVHADMEAAGYAFAPVDLCAAGVGAPHIRQRLWFVADSSGEGLPRGERSAVLGTGRGQERGATSERGRASALGLADTHGGVAGLGRGTGSAQGTGVQRGPLADGCGVLGVVDDRGGPGPTNGYWRAADWLACRDGKWRPVEPGASPLAHGSAARVGRLRGYGNAIVAQAAIEVIRATL